MPANVTDKDAKSSVGRAKTTSTFTTENRQRATYSGQLNPVIKRLYSLAIFDLRGGLVHSAELDPAGLRKKTEYFFTVPPRVHEVSEPYATTIIPTQRGGKYIESHGSILKDIRISGTTGLRPNPNRRGIENIPLIGSAASHLADQVENLVQPALNISKRNQVDASEPLGYDDIMFLRNLFRYFSDLRENGEGVDTVMLWRNAKDNDYWIVEPMEFRLMQSSKSPLTYDYSITLRTISPFVAEITFPEDPLAAILATRRLFSRVQQYNQSLKKTFAIVSTQIDRLEGLGIFAVSSILNPIISVAEGVNQLISKGENFGDALKYNTQRLKDNLDAEIRKMKGEVDPNVPFVDPYPNRVSIQDVLVNILRNCLRTCNKILSESAAQDTVGSKGAAVKERISNAYNKGGTTLSARNAPTTGGSSTFIGNEPDFTAVAQDIVHAGEDIRGAAGRLLGDRGRWHILAVLNDLKAPYITVTGNNGTLKPGDTILYPSLHASSTSVVSAGNPDDSETDGSDQFVTGPVQHVYGRDLRLRSVPVQVGGVSYTDLSINQRGDISTVVGIPNVDQAIRVKFSTEQGELPVHPKFGAKFPIGAKGTAESANEFHIFTEATFYSDYRISTVENLEFSVIADALVLSANLRLINSSDRLSTSIALRRF